MAIQRAKPIVEQIKPILIKRIRDRHYPPGSRLPSESELARELSVSRATVRAVLAQMAAEGLIFRRQGDGTYVNERFGEIDSQYREAWNLSRIIESNGFRASIRSVTIDQRPAEPLEAERLAISEGDQAMVLKRVFLADRQPVVYTTNVIPLALVNRSIAAADATLSIDKLLQKYCDEEITYAITDIEAVAGGPLLSAFFDRPIDYPILKLVETFFNKNNRPLVLGLSYYDQTSLRLRLVQPWG